MCSATFSIKVILGTKSRVLLEFAGTVAAGDRHLNFIEHFPLIKGKGVEVVIFEPTLKEETFFNSRVIRDYEKFASMCDVVVANRMSAELKDIVDKVYTRDVFNRD